MSNIALDLKKFKYVSSDEKSCVLEHSDGHKLTISKKSLSKKMREQLEALANSDTTEKTNEKPKEDDKIAEGGRVKYAKGEEVEHPRHPIGSKDSLDQIDAKNRQKIERRDAPTYKDKDLDVRTADQKARKLEQDKLYGYAEGGTVESGLQDNPETTQLDPVLARKREIYNTLSSSSMSTIPFMDRKGMPPEDPSLYRFGPQGEEPPTGLNSKTWGQAEQEYQKETADNAAQQAATQQRTIEQNTARVAAGLAPIPVPDIQQSGPAPSPEVTERIPTSAPTDIAAPSPTSSATSTTPTLDAGYKKEKAAIDMQAKATIDLAANQLKVLEANELAQQAIRDEYKQEFDALSAERRALVQDIQEGQVDPNKFWEGDPKTGAGGHSKIMAAIGMIVAGFNPTNSPNAAINFLKFQMEQNLESQKSNLTSKQSLLSANLQQFGNMRQAIDMTRVMQADVVKNQLEQAAAKASSPLAKAAALKAAGELDKEYAPLFQKVTTNATIARLTSGIASTDDLSRAPQVIDAIAASDPEKAKDLRGRLIPEVGFAQTEKDATDLKEIRSGVLEAKAGLDKLKKLVSKPAASLSLEDRAEAKTLQQTLVGALRLPITGPGAMSEQERAMLENIIANPATIFSLDSTTKRRLETLQGSLDDKFAASARARGVNVKSTEEKKDSKLKEFEAWAAKNPKHPKAIEFNRLREK